MEFGFNAGILCLDFTNSVYERPGYDQSTPSAPIELINTFQDLLRWCEVSKLLSKKEITQLEKESFNNSSLAERALSKVISVREIIFSLFYSVTKYGAAAKVPLDDFNALILTLPKREIQYHDQSYQWSWSEPLSGLDRILAPIIINAAELLSSASLDRIRVCSAKDCGWLFLDTSKSGRRRWCDMADCGNLEKQRRYQQTRLNS